MRTSMTLSSYIIFPIMFGLAAVATPLITLLLTDKWLPCVPYLQIYCFSMAFYPVHSCNLQTINAMGRSDIFLKMEIIKKSYGLLALIIAVLFFDSPIAIAATGIFTTVIGCFVNAFPNKKLIGYSYFEQMRDILPSFALSLVMLAGIWAVSLIPMGTALALLLEITVGFAVYVALSAALKIKPFMMILSILKSFLKKKKGAA